jgi:hypothetical protein
MHKITRSWYNLSFCKTDVLPNGVAADVLQLTFDGVELLRTNKYYICKSRDI